MDNMGHIEESLTSLSAVDAAAGLCHIWLGGSVEAVFPGEYGTPKPWYFFLMAGSADAAVLGDTDTMTNAFVINVPILLVILVAPSNSEDLSGVLQSGFTSNLQLL